MTRQAGKQGGRQTLLLLTPDSINDAMMRQSHVVRALVTYISGRAMTSAHTQSAITACSNVPATAPKQVVSAD
jgi:hypothetical protein